MRVNINPENKNQSGFTLVELSVVILIIGILISGVAAGINLVEQVKLNLTIQRLQTYSIAYTNFKQAYGQAPGDFSSASAFWPTGCVAGASTDCNGDGNGTIGYYWTPAVGSKEIHLAWKHLQLAKMIRDGFELVPASLLANDGVSYAGGIPGVNQPVTPYEGSGYRFSFSGYNTDFDQNVLLIAGSIANQWSAITPFQAYSIDKKLDDGLVGNSQFIGAMSGKFRAFVFFLNCNLGNEYVVQDPKKDCSMQLNLE